MSDKRIIKNCDAVLFTMPALDDERCSRELMNSVEEVQRRAYEEGFMAGERAGFSAGEDKALILLEQLEGMTAEIAVFKNDLIAKLEPQVVSLATTIAKKVIIEEISMRPEVIVTMVKEALKRLQRIGKITVRINTAIHDIFMKHKKDLLDIHPDIVFDINSSVPVSGPLVVSDIEEVITDIDSLLMNIIDIMKKENTVESRESKHSERSEKKKKGADQANDHDAYRS